jgi:hypothetical protein
VAFAIPSQSAEHAAEREHGNRNNRSGSGLHGQPIEVRNEGRNYMREMIRASFSVGRKEVAATVADELAHFSMLRFDGAFVSVRRQRTDADAYGPTHGCNDRAGSGLLNQTTWKGRSDGA